MPNILPQQSPSPSNDRALGNAQATLNDPLQDLTRSEVIALRPSAQFHETTFNEPANEPTLNETAAIEAEWTNSTQQLINTLPQAWTRGLLYLLTVCLVVILPWAMLTKVDEVSSAQGRLEPKGKTIRLDAPVGGKVAAITAQEGQTVQAGQPLMELESDLILAELQQAQARLEGQMNRLTQLESIKNQLEVSVRIQQMQRQAQVAEQLAQISQAQQRLTFHQDNLALAQELSTKASDRVTRYRSLREQGALSGVQLEDAERGLIENQQQFGQIQSDLQQTQTEIRKQQSAYERVLREGDLLVVQGERQLKELQAQIVELQSEVRQSRNQLRGLQYQWQQRSLRSPVDGTIFELPVQNAGAVLQSGQTVAQIAPRGAKLVLRAQMASQNSGLLKVGLPVKVKFDAYPFQDYGIVEGQLRWIAPNSKSVQTPHGQKEVFELEIEFDRPQIENGLENGLDNGLENGQQAIALTAGQTATAEIVTRQRRVIDFFIDPFRKLQQSGLEF